jgi:hypothetical protein
MKSCFCPEFIKHTSILLLLLGLLLIIPNPFFAQSEGIKFIEPSDTFNQRRFNTAATFAGVTYSGFSIGLYNIWYRQYEQTSFHLFNDWNEWNNMDKMGHFYTAYFQGVLCYKGAKWVGLNKKKSILTGVVLGSLFQTTIEVMDGFSEKWGFSVPDIAYNIAGSTTFAIQQWYWDEQRISFKVSSYKRPYSNEPLYSDTGETFSSLHNRANNLYGSSFPERFLKDYNAQTLWASINIHAFLPEGNTFPKWLNIGVGTGSENLYGGFKNEWSVVDQSFSLPKDDFPRYRQFFIGPDINLTKLSIKNYYLKSLIQILNIFKLPMPAIEINTLGQVKFHILHF